MTDPSDLTVFKIKLAILRVQGKNKKDFWTKVALCTGPSSLLLVLISTAAAKIIIIVPLLAILTIVALIQRHMGVKLLHVLDLIEENKDNNVALSVIRAEFLSEKTNLWLGRPGR